MALIGGKVGYRLLKAISSGQDVGATSSEEYATAAEKLEIHFGEKVWSDVKDKIVLDFGCGTGELSVELAKKGAAKVIGIDIQQHFLDRAAAIAAQQGVGDKCEFAHSTSDKVDVVFSVDSFEHFEDPARVLALMRARLKPRGQVRISFGWPWYHPRGGHLFSVFPWAHLIFTENSLIRWRSDFKTDGATRFCEVAGGLNQMSIRRFERLVNAAGFARVEIRLRPIRPLRWLHYRLTREFTTAIVNCTLTAA